MAALHQPHGFPKPPTPDGLLVADAGRTGTTAAEVVPHNMIHGPIQQDQRASGGDPREARRNKYRREREALVDAAARALCVASFQAHREPEVIAQHFRGDPFVPGPTELRYAGGLKAVKERIAHGDLGIEEEVKPWTGGFWWGLTLSGALRPASADRPACHQVWELAHRELVMDLEEAAVPMSMERSTGRNGVRRLTQCHTMLLPPADEADVLAGLFAGSRLNDLDGQEWLVLPSGAEIVALLDSWTILRRPAPAFRGKERIAVSPFWAAFFTGRMPPHSAARIMDCERPGQCPLLPMCVYDAYFARRGRPLPPRAGVLPWLKSTRTIRRMRIDRSRLHRTLVLELGVCGLHVPLKLLMREWYESACRERGVEP